MFYYVSEYHAFLSFQKGVKLKIMLIHFTWLIPKISEHPRP